MAYLGNSPGVASQRVVTTFTATAGQTVFTPQSGYTLGYCDVFLNGIKLVNGDDYTASNGTSITLASGAAVGDSVEVVAYIPRGLSDGYTKAETDARHVLKSGDTMTGNLLLNAAGNTIDASNRIRSREGFRTTSNNGTNEYQTGGFYDGSAYQIVHSTDNFVTHALRLGIDSAGRVTMPYQPRFCGQRSNGNVTNAYILLNSVRTNVGNCYNTSTGRFTCPVAGVYRISFFIPMSTTNSYIRATRNGGIVAEVYTGFEKPVGGHTALEQCAAGDYIEFYVEGTTNGTYASNYNSVSIELA